MVRRTARTAEAEALAARFAAFVAEAHPLLASALVAAVDEGTSRGRLLARLEKLLEQHLDAAHFGEIPETTPRVSPAERFAIERSRVLESVQGFFEREAIVASFTQGERLELLRGMVWTRAVDNQLKSFFTSGRVRYQGRTFQGKGFRSLGQEAIYGAPLRLRRGPAFRLSSGDWSGDIVAPMIRDLGAVLAMRCDADAVRQVLSAQMGKAGPPMNGKDLHVGDFAWGVLPTAAPLGISALNATGLAFALARAGSGRVVVSFIGEGATSLGEWHEALSFAAVQRLPAVFCIENNQTALSTSVREQCRARVFAEKAAGYGIPGLTLDGTDPEAIAAAIAWSADRARAGLGPTLLELVSMRIAGHAHHDDMLYLGKDAPPSWDYPALAPGGYADAEAYAYWAARDPIPTYANRLVAEGVIPSETLAELQAEATSIVAEAAEAVIALPWPDPEDAGRGVFYGEVPRTHRDPLAETDGRSAHATSQDLWQVEDAPPFDREGRTFLEGVMLGVRDALRGDPRVFVIGQDVGGHYGNAFLLLRPLLEEFGDRIVNSTLAEGTVLGVSIGASLAGLRPIAEMQFNDFVATGFNQLVNNAAMLRYRWGGAAPMVVRMPWGGLRNAGPYHSQNTEAWFYRTPGLKLVVPSTPSDARALFASAMLDPDPVLFYEHIALYREPRIRQRLPEAAPGPIPLGQAAFRRLGEDLAFLSYGAYVHHALSVADRLAADGIEAAVLDLRSLVPLDRARVLEAVRRTGRILIVHEDSRTGGIGESLAAFIQEEAFTLLDAPVRIVGALDTPVPYAPSLEDAYLPGLDRIERAARLLVRF